VTALRHKLFSGTAYTLASVLVAQVISLVTSVAYARILGPEKLGVLAIVTTLTTAIIPLSSLGIGTALTRMIPEYRRKRKEALEALVGTAFGITLVAGVAVTVVYFLLAGPLSGLYAQPELVLFVQITALLVIVDAVVALGAAVVQGFERVKELAVLTLASRALTVPVIIAFTFYFGLLGAILGTVVTQLLTFSIYMWAVRRILRLEKLAPVPVRLHRPTASAIMRIALPLFGAFVVLRPALLFQSSFLALMVGYAQLGQFRVASGLYRIALLLPASLSVPLLPAISAMYAEETRERTRTQLSSLLRITAFLGLPIALAIGLGAVPIISILYGAEYVAAAPLVFVISAAAFVETLGAVVENTLLGTGRTRLVLLLTVMQAGVIAGGTWLFVSAFGLLGMGFAMLLNAAVYACVVGALLLAKKEIRFADFRAILALGVVAFLGAAVLVSVGRLADVWISAIYFAVILAAEWKLLSDRDWHVLRDAVRSMLGRG
jgi:O-antigen/teichoic acid export membrane protein